jgi:hypothetical protein
VEVTYRDKRTSLKGNEINGRESAVNTDLDGSSCLKASAFFSRPFYWFLSNEVTYTWDW